ncbi:MAG: transporter substrate-binding domain-containing protein [Candidatus Binatia bacterium]
MRAVRWNSGTSIRLGAAALFVAIASAALAADAPPLRVGIAPNYPPLAFKENGDLDGIEVDFAQRLEKALGRRIVLVEVAWEELPEALLEKKTIDMIMSGTSITERRKQRVNFTEPYLEIGQMAIVRQADYPELREPAAMDRPQSRVGFISRSTGEAWAREHLKKAKLHGYSDTDEGVRALQNEQIDYFIQDAPAVWRVTGGFINSNPNLRGIYRPLTTEYLAWAVPKDNPELLEQLNAVLEKWKTDGTLDDVLDDWITVKKTTIELKPRADQ